MRTCVDCGIRKPIDQFYDKRACCKACSVERTKRYRGCSTEDYNRMLAAQGGRCAGCGVLATSQKRRLHVDHDHACCPYGKACQKCIRGLLCNNCNQAIGYAGDDPQRLRALADYIEVFASPLSNT